MLITATHLTKYNNLKCIVDDVSFTINEQDKVALIGINGTGKSTLLKMIAQIDDYQGEILRKKDIRISYLPQNPDFQNELTVLKQVYEYVGHDVEEYEVKAILNKFGIINHEQKIAELSGGQQQRVLLARALCAAKKMILLDEPVAGLDPKATTEMYELIQRLNKNEGLTVIMVSHDVHAFSQYATHILHVAKTDSFYGSKDAYMHSEKYLSIGGNNSCKICATP